ncbi:glycosyl hydrolase [Leptospira fluminis]|uniref:Glycosyl hydrolase n=1 Tax=Leptospira fluminis TaxID=2484979 RepID=A0A4R9GTT8_9LEPT|nr:putative glycoside hydrolase [Leptospira fluminis]TGK22213.1 glycosyl hydrolase [Leptospira fluminis]
MRKSFSILPLFLFSFFPLSVCAEFTLPFPENTRKKEISSSSGSAGKEEQARAKSGFLETANRSSKPAGVRPEKESKQLSEEFPETKPIPRKAISSDSKPPKFYRGIYVHNSLVSNRSHRKKWEALLTEAADAGVNVLVIDLQATTPSRAEIDRVRKLGFYPIGRLVNFAGGLKTEFPAPSRLNSILQTVRNACESGFPEIQLDYIRYADESELKIPVKKKYQNIGSIISRIRSEANKCEDPPYLGADIFGRIPFNKDDTIGQKVEVFAQLVDVLYPMLYPSHFYGHPERISNPYKTIFDGLTNAKKRALPETRVVGYIQGFSMKISHSKKNLKDYVKAQIEASVVSKSEGFVVWNAWSDYRETFKAMKESVREGKLDISD